MLKVYLLDLAVGAPNAETVYVYRSYPVVKINGNVYPLSKELKINETTLKFRVCWSLASTKLHQTGKTSYHNQIQIKLQGTFLILRNKHYNQIG